MNLVKEKMIKIIQDQPEDSSYDEILQELSFIKMINQGLEDSISNKIIDSDLAKEQVNAW